MPNFSYEPPVSSKVQNDKLKDMDVLCTFKIKIKSQKFDHWYIKDQGPYKNQDQDSEAQSVTSSILQSPKLGLKGHYSSLYLQNQDKEPKLRIWVYQRPVTISKLRSRFQTPVWNLQCLAKPQVRTETPGMFFAP